MKVYTTRMLNMREKGYIMRVLEDELLLNEGLLGYIPHHGVCISPET